MDKEKLRKRLEPYYDRASESYSKKMILCSELEFNSHKGAVLFNLLQNRISNQILVLQNFLESLKNEMDK